MKEYTQLDIFGNEEPKEVIKKVLYKNTEIVRSDKIETLNILNNLLHQKEIGKRTLITDAVVMNPPYSLKWNAIEDERFKLGLAPQSRSDFAFLQHGFYNLENNGMMAILLPHGVLFRGGVEATIRKNLLDNKMIHSIIGLPNKLFLNTAIPTCIIILTKQPNDDVLFIDASLMFKKEGALNILENENVEVIIKSFVDRKQIDKFSSVIGYDEIKGNDYNLNIPRYVDTYEEPEPVDEHAVIDELFTLRKEIKELSKELGDIFDELVDNREDKTLLPRYVKYFKEGGENESK